MSNVSSSEVVTAMNQPHHFLNQPMNHARNQTFGINHKDSSVSYQRGVADNYESGVNINDSAIDHYT